MGGDVEILGGGVASGSERRQDVGRARRQSFQVRHGKHGPSSIFFTQSMTARHACTPRVLAVKFGLLPASTEDAQGASNRIRPK